MRVKERLTTKLSDFLEETAGKQHTSVLDRAGVWLAYRARWASNLARARQPGKAELWRGVTSAGQPLNVAYICDAAAEWLRTPPYLRSILFADSEAVVETRGSVPLLHMRSAAELLAQQADLVIVERNCLMNWRPTRGKHMVVPAWIHMQMHISPDQPWTELEAKMRNQHNNIQKIRSKGVTAQFRRDAATEEAVAKLSAWLDRRSRKGQETLPKRWAALKDAAPFWR